MSREAPRPASAVRTINVKKDDPPADVAADRMEAILANARSGGTKVVIVIHGYGSRGEGGSIKDAVRTRLRKMVAEHRIRVVVFGENFGPGDDDAIRIASTFKELLAPHVFGSRNEGITIVTL